MLSLLIFITKSKFYRDKNLNLHEFQCLGESDGSIKVAYFVCDLSTGVVWL
jgi:hypothetical protein